MKASPPKKRNPLSQLVLKKKAHSSKLSEYKNPEVSIIYTVVRKEVAQKWFYGRDLMLL